MNRFIKILAVLLIALSVQSFADEQIVDFSDKSVAVLNEELRKLRSLVGTGGTSSSVTSYVSGESIASGEVCYVKSDGKLWKADADSVTTMPVFAISSGGTFVTSGEVSNGSWDWTVGGLIYASGTPGGLTQTHPSGTGKQVQVVGVALSATKIFFNPSYVLVELA